MTDIATNENVYDASQNDAVNTENEKKLFTQEKLDEIIAERLSRQRKVNEALSSVKTLLKSAAEKGYIKGGSYAEMAKELAEKLKNGSEETTQVEEDKTQDKESDAHDIPHNECHNDTDLLTAICEDSSEDAADEETENVNESVTERESVNEEVKDADNSFTAVLSDIKSRYPKEKVEKLFAGDLFERFAKGRSGSMREIADDFFSFISSVNNDEDVGYNEPPEYSSFTSTAFSSGSGTPHDVTLTKQQMEIAKSAGMSYREYANLLSSVPKRTRKVF